MIIKLYEDTPRIVLSVVEPFCNGRFLYDPEVRLSIRKPDCGLPPRVRYTFDPCNPERIEEPKLPLLSYPVFELTSDGKLVFYFDNKLWSMPPGRYWAQVDLGDCCLVPRFDIDLKPCKSYVDSITVLKPSCGGNQC